MFVIYIGAMIKGAPYTVDTFPWVTMTIFVFFELHYLQRSFVFPAKRRGTSKMPLSIIFTGFFFTSLQLSGRKLLDSHKQLLSDATVTVRDFARDTVGDSQNQLKLLQSKIQLFAKQKIENDKTAIEHLSDKLTLLSPANILRRGFSITRRRSRRWT